MRRFSTRVLSVLTLLALLGVEPGLFAQPRSNQLIPAPARKAGEGAGPFQTLVIRGALLIDGTGAPNPRPGRHRHRAESHPRDPFGRDAWPAARAEAPATGCRFRGRRHRHVRHAGHRRRPRPHRRAAKEPRSRVRLQAVDGPRRDHGARRFAHVARDVGERTGSQRAQRDCRAPDVQLPDGRERLGPGFRRHARASAGVGAVGG